MVGEQLLPYYVVFIIQEQTRGTEGSVLIVPILALILTIENTIDKRKSLLKMGYQANVIF